MKRRMIGIRTYAFVAGLVLILFGLSGFVSLTGVSVGESAFHVLIGAFFIFLGLGPRDVELVREMVSVGGIALIVAKVIVDGLSLANGDISFLRPIELACLLIGILSVVAARYLPPRDTPSSSSRVS